VGRFAFLPRHLITARRILRTGQTQTGRLVRWFRSWPNLALAARLAALQEKGIHKRVF